MFSWAGSLRIQQKHMLVVTSARPIARAAAESVEWARIVLAGLDVAVLVEIARGTRTVQEHVFRLKLADGVVYAEREGKHLFLQPATPDWMVVNQNGAILLSRCDGSTLDEVLGNARESVWEQARALFAEALARGLLVDLSASPQGNELQMVHSLQRKNPQPLSMVHLKLTNECNLHCSYCYAESGRGTAVLSCGELETIAREVAVISPSVAYALSGGEPLLHPSALDFAETVQAAGNEVHLLTNGTLINEANVKRVGAAADMVKISLDGVSGPMHASTRGGGNFARVTRAIELLLGCGANVIVAMTVTRMNCGDIPAMVARYGSRLALQPLFKAGRGSAANDLALTGLEYYRALAAVDGVAPMGAFDAKLKSLRGRGVRRCAMAEREISIAETGDVYPCQLLHEERFCAGNVRQRPLGEIYADSPVFARMREISVDTLAKCTSCAVRYLCGGACRARDLFETGSEEWVGEFCAYEREALLNGIFASVEMRTV
jgi:radical SAM protein with 4Fe4S-binding SPASM domain